MEDAIEQSFKISLSLLRFLGVYSYEKSSPLRKLCILIPYLQSISVVILGFVDLLLQKHFNLTELTLSLMFLIEASNFCVRVALCFRFSTQVKKCVTYFGHRRFQPKDEEEKCMVKNCVWICNRNSRIFAIVIFVAIVLWSSLPFLKGKKTLTVNVWLPFNYSSDFPTYCGSSLYVDAAGIYLGLIGTSIDPLLGGLIHHATTQLAILKYNLKNFHRYEETEEVKFETVNEFLQKCIERHNAILQFVANFESCFSGIIFTQIGASTLSLCFCCIAIAGADVKSLDIYQFILLYFIFVGEIVFYCFYGTLLFDESQTLNEAVYLGPWYISDVKTRKFLIILMERAKRPIVITAGKIIELTLDTLTSVIKTSYSLIAVFKK